jgi:hypothetical protein
MAPDRVGRRGGEYVHDNPDGEHERLWSIVGEWTTDGHVVGDPPIPVKGTDTYEVLAGGYFLVHHVDVTVGDQQFEPSRSSENRRPRVVGTSHGRSTIGATPRSCG